MAATVGQEHLRIQYELTRALGDAETLTGAVRAALRIIAGHLGWSFAAWWSVNDDGDELRCEDVWPGSADDPFTARTLTMGLRAGVGVPGKVWAERRALALDDLAAQPREEFPRAAAAAEAGLHAALAFPVEYDGRVFGVLEFYSARREQLDEGVLELMTAVGQQIGQFRRRVLVQEELRASEARQAAIVAGALDCIITVDERGDVMDFNRAAQRTFGYSEEQARGRELAKLIVPPVLRDRHRAALQAYLAGAPGAGTLIGKRLELTGMRSDGSTFPVELTLSPTDVGGRLLVTGFVRDLSERAALEAERAELVARERRARAEAQRVSTQLQASLLPSLQLANRSLRLITRYRPGEHRLMLGGDFYDVAELDDGTLAVVIGDVSGHGARAAALGATLRAAWRMLVHRGHDHQRVLESLQTLLERERDSPEFFATALYARIDLTRGVAQLASAGHPWPVRVSPPASIDPGLPGPPLGAVPAAAWPVHEAPVSVASGLLFYTDGLIEGRAGDSHSRLGLAGLLALLADVEASGRGVDDLIQHVIERHRADLPDDLAILLLSAAGHA